MGICLDPDNIKIEILAIQNTLDDASGYIDGDWEDVDKASGKILECCQNLVRQYGYSQGLYEKLRRDHHGK